MTECHSNFPRSRKETTKWNNTMRLMVAPASILYDNRHWRLSYRNCLYLVGLR